MTSKYGNIAAVSLFFAALAYLFYFYVFIHELYSQKGAVPLREWESLMVDEQNPGHPCPLFLSPP